MTIVDNVISKRIIIKKERQGTWNKTVQTRQENTNVSIDKRTIPQGSEVIKTRSG